MATLKLVNALLDFVDSYDLEKNALKKSMFQGRPIFQGLSMKHSLRTYTSSIDFMKSGLRDQNPQWQQTMIRIKDPKETIPFYEKNFGMILIHEYHFPKWKFSLYFLCTPIPGLKYPPKNTKQSEELLWSYDGVVLELTHNHGTEKDDEYSLNNGNVKPFRGFGHIAFNCDDVYASCQELEKNGVKFQKKPDEGRMKGLAFALDPNNYWIEIVKRGDNSQKLEMCQFNLSQTMIRVKNPEKSLKFYCDYLGMKLVRESHYEKGKFSIYFLSSPNHIDPNFDLDNHSFEERRQMMKNNFHPFIELTHNWGTEDEQAFSYHDGNQEPQGFGHIGFLVNDLEKTCEILVKEGVLFKKLPKDGGMKGIAFAYDPDKYWVELIQRGVSFS